MIQCVGGTGRLFVPSVAEGKGVRLLLLVPPLSLSPLPSPLPLRSPSSFHFQLFIGVLPDSP